jgi:hypothetical protein
MADIDLARVKRNVGKMVGMGAPEADIDAYISSEGTSIDAVKAFKGGATRIDVGRKPTVPLTVPDETGREVDLRGESGAALRQRQSEQEAVREAEQAAFDESRTIPTRIRDTLNFAWNVPVRALTKGQYGIGDVFGLANENAGQNALASEMNFARANQGKNALETWNPLDIPTLSTAAAAGDLLTGVPLLNTMGGVPGQMLRTGAAAVRQLPSEVRRVAADTSGAAKIPGGPASASRPLSLSSLYARQGDDGFRSALGAMDEAEIATRMERGGFVVSPGMDKAAQIEDALAQAKAKQADRFAAAGGGNNSFQPGSAQPPSGPPVPPPSPPSAPVPPSGGNGGGNSLLTARDALEAAGQRQNVLIPRMVAEGQTTKDVAAALEGVPYSGTPIRMAYERGLRELGGARDAAATSLGAVDVERAGQGIKDAASDWIKKSSREELGKLYDEVYNTRVNPDVTQDLAATRTAAQRLIERSKASATTDELAAVKLVEDAITRPEGLTVKGLADLRTAVGRRIDAAATNPDPAEAAYKQLYGALTNDLKAAVKAAGGDEALKAWNTANRTAEVFAGKRRRLAKVLGASEDSLSAEKVAERLYSMGKEKGGDIKGIRTVKGIVGQQQWNDLAGARAARMGTNPKTKEFSGDRFLSEYGQMSPAAKSEFFGKARPALDDIVTISEAYSSLASRFNKSRTGAVGAISGVLKLLANPAGLATNIGTAAVNPLSTLTIGGQLGALQSARAVAWSLAKPSNANRARGVMKALYRAEAARLTKASARAIAEREQGLSSAVRSFAMQVANETGGNADEISAAMAAEIDKIRNGNPK